MTTTPEPPSPQPQPRDIALEQESPELAADLEAQSDRSPGDQAPAADEPASE